MPALDVQSRQLEPAEARTCELLQRWHAGDRAALAALVEREVPWIRAWVERRLGPTLRGKLEPDDVVQQTVVEALQYAPRFVVSRHDHFRGLLCRMVENVIRHQDHWFRAQRRAISREQPLSGGSALRLDPAAGSVTHPSVAAQRVEEREWMRLALELVPEEDRRLIVQRAWQELSFAQLAAKLDIGEDAARMRFTRALARLGVVVRKLKRGELDDLLLGEPGVAGAAECNGGGE